MRGIDDHRDHARAPRERREHVAQRRCRGRGDDADRPWEGGQGSLARRVEESLGLELRLELGERFEERAQARAPHFLDGELVAPARLVERDPGAHLDLLAIFGTEIEEAGARAPHDAIDLRGGVLEAEVPVTRRRLLHSRELARDPKGLELVLEERANARIQLRDGEGRRRIEERGHGKRVHREKSRRN